jgi:hypothetical protein
MEKKDIAAIATLGACNIAGWALGVPEYMQKTLLGLLAAAAGFPLVSMAWSGLKSFVGMK